MLDCTDLSQTWTRTRLIAIQTTANPRLQPAMIALTGYSRTGKSTVANVLKNNWGYVELSMGSIIKQQLDDLTLQHLGFSAFTETDSEKQQIRHLLEHWGDVNYTNILDEFFNEVRHHAFQNNTSVVNSRLCRLQEARSWRDMGGIVVEITRPHWNAATPWEEEVMLKLRTAGLVDFEIANDGTESNLERDIDLMMTHLNLYQTEHVEAATRMAAQVWAA